MNKAVVIVSGGMDSMTLLYKVRADGFEPHVLSFDYGQRHKIELESVAKVCEDQGFDHKVIDITSLNTLLGGSALTSDIEVPKGHYAEENMKATVVPNRNMILLSIATGWAVSLGANDVFCGVHAGDHAIYPDCRGEFIEALSRVTQIANYTPVKISAPFLAMDKGDILQVGLDLGVDYAQTHTCYEGQSVPCGKCGACVERVEAFLKVGVVDPKYPDHASWEAAADFYQTETIKQLKTI